MNALLAMASISTGEFLFALLILLVVIVICKALGLF